MRVALQPKVALVHDYLREYGGAERVVEDLHEIFPDAPVYTAYYNPKGLGIHNERIKNWDIRTSWMQHTPFANRLISPFRIFAPLMFESFDLKDFDVVISSSAIYFANAVRTKPETLHIAYIHTPPRYLYGIATSFERKKHLWLTNIGVAVMNHLLRIWDFEISKRPDILVANSQNVAARIKKFYRKSAVVIYPPVNTSKEGLPVKRIGDYYLSVCRLWKNKGVDIIIQACKEADAPLKVVGIGPELSNLKKIGGKNIEFLGEVSDEEKMNLYAGAKAFIAAASDEDFGITLVESQATGTPVIALKSGGFLETIIEGKTGEFFAQATKESLVSVLKNFDPGKYRVENLQKQAEKFSKEQFKKDILGLVEKYLLKKD